MSPPEIGIEVSSGLQRLATRPALAAVLPCCPSRAPTSDGDHLTRSAPVIEEAFEEMRPRPRSPSRSPTRAATVLAGAEPDETAEGDEPVPGPDRVDARRARTLSECAFRRPLAR